MPEQQAATDLFPDFDESLLDFHGIEPVQGIGHPDTAGVAAMFPCDHTQPASAA